MATARTTQAHQKRVQKIAEEAADKIAADAPFDEEVVVVVEELPPGSSSRTRHAGATQVRQDATDATLGLLAQTQKSMAAAMSNWINLVTTPVAGSMPTMDLANGLFDPRRILQESFRVAEELLASQKEFALKVVDVMTPARAA